MRLTILGAYLPNLTPTRLSAWVSTTVDSFVVGMRELKSEGLAKSWSDEEILSRAAELPEEYEDALKSAALFEMLVEDHAGEFDPYEIFERHTTQVAWEPAYLSIEGEEVIAERTSDLAEVSAFRVAFYVHDWPEAGELIGPGGPLVHPPFTAVPERLWSLAPYELLD